MGQLIVMEVVRNQWKFLWSGGRERWCADKLWPGLHWGRWAWAWMRPAWPGAGHCSPSVLCFPFAPYQSLRKKLEGSFKNWNDLRLLLYSESSSSSLSSSEESQSSDVTYQGWWSALLSYPLLPCFSRSFHSRHKAPSFPASGLCGDCSPVPGTIPHLFSEKRGFLWSPCIKQPFLIPCAVLHISPKCLSILQQSTLTWFFAACFQYCLV